MNFPQVSIITACYNKANTIEDTIKSVLNQSYINIQYIIVDANSNDGTADIISKYMDKIHLWIRESDQGIADAWNKGIKASTGDIIGIINADDYYEPNAVELAVNALSENPDKGFVFGDLEMRDMDGNKQYLLKGFPNYGDRIKFDMPAISHPTVFVRREIYKKYGLFDLAYKSSLDYEFLLRIYLQGVKGLYIEHKLAIMRLGGISDINYIQSHRETAKVSIRYGYNPIFAKTRCYFKILTSITRRLLETAGLIGIVKFYRRLTGKPHRYYKN
ncbi:MAG TPA: glycosyltransferase family 2 protein [Selenomonadales bacterium]|nr:glycosyltransferase family 2 protein [Selenomonadales bacterium]